jgi:hypothetical protein
MGSSVPAPMPSSFSCGDPVHLGVLGDLQPQQIGFAVGDLVNHGSPPVQHTLFRMDRMVEAGVGADLPAQLLGHGVGPCEDDMVAHRDKGGCPGEIIQLCGDNVSTRADPDLFVARQDQVEPGDRYSRNLQAGPRWAAVAGYRNLKFDLYLVQTTPLQQGGEIGVFLEYGGRFPVDADIAQGHAAGHQRQGDKLTAEDFDLKGTGPDQGRFMQLAAIGGAADNERPLGSRRPGHHDHRRRRHRGRHLGAAILGHRLQIGGRHHRQLNARFRIIQAEQGRGRPGNRQGQHVAALIALRIDIVGELHCVYAGLVYTPGKPVNPLDKLHRLAIDGRLTQRRARRQDRDQGPFILENLDLDRDSHLSRLLLVVVAHNHRDPGLPDRVGGRRMPGILAKLRQHCRIVAERDPDLTAISGDSLQSLGRVCENQKK